MNLNALERLARHALAHKPAHALAAAGTMHYTLTGAENTALRSRRWQDTARIGREQDGKPPVVADNPDMGGWF